MEQRHRDAILKNVDYLVENTGDEHFEIILKKFGDNYGLSPYMLEKICAGTGSNEKKRIFYEMVPKRGPHAFDKLFRCLYDVGLQNLANYLKESYRLLLDGCASSKLNCSNSNNKNSKECNPIESELISSGGNKKSSEECYCIQSEPKGYVLIININRFTFEPNDIRNGSEKDVIRLEKLWKKLGYKVIIKEDLECKEFMREIDDFINLTQSEKLDSIFVFIMTHGMRNKTNSREVELKMADSQNVSSEWILHKFSSANCKLIADLPKVIFIQACRGETYDWGTWVQYDAEPSNPIYSNNIDGIIKTEPKPQYANLLVVFSTLPGYVSKRDPNDGAPFIRELCISIESKAKTSHILDIIHEVNRKLKEEVVRSLQLSERGYFQIIHYENWRFNFNLYLT